MLARRSSALFASLCLFSGFSLAACAGGEIDTTSPGGAGAMSAAGTGASSQGGGTGAKGGAAGKGGAGGVAGNNGGAGGGTSGASGGAGASGATGGTMGGKAGSSGGTAGASGKSGASGASGNAGSGGAMGGKAGAAGGGGKAGSAGAGPTCGDGTKNGAEQCDKTDLGGATCASVLKTSATGTLSCFGNCSLDTSKCMLGGGGAGGASGAGGAAPSCGDGTKNGFEQCDGGDLAGATCASALGDPGATGALACFANCSFDASKCALSMGTGGMGAGGGTGGAPVGTSCGDGIKNGTDQCDGSDVGMETCAGITGDAAATGTVKCFANCTFDLTTCSTPSPNGGPFCGDGTKNAAEQCDGASFGAATCATAVGPGSTGTLSCFGNCIIDASACSLPTGTGGAGGAGAGGSAGSAGAGGAVTCGAGSVACPAGKTCLGNAPCCVPTTCQGKTYACGDCLDNDGDGLVDTADPSCLGPCSDNEAGYLGGIPGQQNAACKMDCYFDQDSGSGNDDCHWDHRCDDHELSPGFYPEASCNYACSSATPTAMCTAKPAALGGTCAAEYASQSAACTSFCGPLTPNGCDCFGCCELPASSGKFVYLGSTDAGGNGTCDPTSVDDPTKCHPCTPVAGCYNACDHCELCIGKPDLPADCLPPVPKCGDGTKNGSDQCDGADLGTPPATCVTVTGNSASTGTVTCNANCTLNGGMCTTPTPTCGDGVIEGFEECDGTNLGTPGATCPSYTGIPTATGSVFCNANCTLNGNMCVVPPPMGTGGAGGATSTCGDGVKNGAEQCDMSDLGGATCRTVLGSLVACGTLKCNANCTLDSSACTLACGQGGTGPGPSCGDGVINQPSEQCDGMALGGATCATATGNPNSMGMLSCFANCTLDTGMCMVPVGGSGGAGGSCGGQVCPSGEQACGLSCQGPCPVNQFCITGCCVAKP
jgi:hypothetical protein